MKFIKICLLSITILFLGIFGITFGNSFLPNNSVDNVAYNENNLKNNEEILNHQRNIKPSKSYVTFDVNFLTNNEVIIFSEWHSESNVSGSEDIFFEMVLTDRTNNDIFKPSIDAPSISDDPVEGFSFTTRKEGERSYFTLNATINKGTWFEVDFIADHDYNLKIEIAEGNPCELDFIAPSKSVINYTDNTGKIINYNKVKVEIDTTWIQDEQILSDDIYFIDEKMTMILDTGDVAGEIDVSEVSSIKVEGLSPSRTYNWSINASYYNGVDQVQLKEKAVNFKTPGITYINIILLVITIILAIASASLLGWLFMRSR